MQLLTNPSLFMEENGLQASYSQSLSTCFYFFGLKSTSINKLKQNYIFKSLVFVRVA